MAQLSKADQTYLTKEQQQEILALKTAWEQANAAGDEQAKKAANQKAEAIRATAGYQGGTSGKEGWPAPGMGYTLLAGGYGRRRQRDVDGFVGTNGKNLRYPRGDGLSGYGGWYVRHLCGGNCSGKKIRVQNRSRGGIFFFRRRAGLL